MLVPADFDPPDPPTYERFRFAPLGPEHNESDHTAWMSSIAHIHATPGFDGRRWPVPMTLEDNRADLETHRDHHTRKIDFAWTVLDPADGTVLGCVYLKPDPSGAAQGEARSWVRADRAELDGVLREHLRPWFATAWPLTVRYA